MNQHNVTWHHGLVADWWREFNHGGDDVAYFLDAVSGVTEPVLDLGCGTGRLLIPLLEAGLDAWGVDPAPSMLNGCRSLCAEHNLSPRLHCQPANGLDIDMDFHTVFFCGAFGLGGSRHDDLHGLQRIYQHLRPGGHLYLDHHLPNFNRKAWQDWVEEPDLPRAWPQHGDRRTARDGRDLQMKSRVLRFNPLEQQAEWEIQVNEYVDGEETRTETYPLLINIYFKPEIELMLRTAGFDLVRVETIQHTEPRPWQDSHIVFIATKRL